MKLLVFEWLLLLIFYAKCVVPQFLKFSVEKYILVLILKWIPEKNLYQLYLFELFTTADILLVHIFFSFFRLQIYDYHFTKEGSFEIKFGYDLALGQVEKPLLFISNVNLTFIQLLVF